METLDNLYRSHAGYVRTICSSILENHPEWIEDAVSNVWYKVSRSFSKFEGNSKFKTWVHRITIRESLNIKRKAETQEKKIREYAKSAYRKESIYYDFDTPETEMMAKQTVKQIYNTFRECTPEMKAVGNMVSYKGMIYKDCAKSIGVPVGTVRSRLHVFRKKINKIDFEQPHYPMYTPYQHRYKMHDNHQMYKND